MNRFKLFRVLAELSQKQAADKLGVKQVSVWQWEHGVTYPKAERLPEIAKLYGCSVSDFFEGGDPVRKKS